MNTVDATASVALGALGAVAVLLIPDPFWRVVCWSIIAALVASDLLIEMPWLNRLETRRTTYVVTSEFVYIVRGLVWRRSVVIATSQILNVEIVQGPLLRAFDLVSVRLQSVVDAERLGPLDPSAAHELRATILDAQVGQAIDSDVEC